jgi:ribosomal RNA-processing protein 12
MSLAELRGCHGFEHKELLDKTFGMAVRVMGPRVVLEAVPLQTALSQ